MVQAEGLDISQMHEMWQDTQEAKLLAEENVQTKRDSTDEKTPMQISVSCRQSNFCGIWNRTNFI